MKKTVIIVLIAACAMAFTACSGSNTNSSAQGSDASQATAASQGESQGSGWVFKSGDVEIAMNAPAAPIIEKLGQAKSSYEAPSCAFDGMDVVYSYAGFDLLTYTSDGKDAKVSGVVLRDDSVETPEGLFIGSDKVAVENTYGKMEEGANNLRVTKGNCELLIILTDGAVSSIQYIAK